MSFYTNTDISLDVEICRCSYGTGNDNPVSKYQNGTAYPMRLRLGAVDIINLYGISWLRRKQCF